MNAREAVQAIYDEHGKLTPTLVVDEARDPDHPLHARFEWDDAVAGEAHRRQQARELIQSFKIVYREATGKQGPRMVRAFQSVQDEDGHAYQPSELVALDPLVRQMVLRNMEREWKQLKDRYSQFGEFVEMIQRDLKAEAAA